MTILTEMTFHIAYIVLSDAVDVPNDDGSQFAIIIKKKK